MENTVVSPRHGAVAHAPCAVRKVCAGTRRTLLDYFSLDIFGHLPVAGRERMPVLKPFTDEALPGRMVAFDEAYTKDDTECIVHFYEDDRRFLRLFRNPWKYLGFLRRCAVVVAPDLSQYADMAYPIRLAHAYLNRAMAAWLQGEGVSVVPNVTWSRGDSYGYSVAGMPEESVIAVNCTGVIGHDISMYRWREGYRNVVLPLKPRRIIRYGDRMPGELVDISVYFENERLKRLRDGSKR